RNQPFTIYMHVLGTGDPVKLATTLHTALATSKTPLGPAPSGSSQQQTAPATPPQIDLDTGAIDQTLGAKGTNNGGVLQSGMPRSTKSTWSAVSGASRHIRRRFRRRAADPDRAGSARLRRRLCRAVGADLSGRARLQPAGGRRDRHQHLGRHGTVDPLGRYGR